MDDRTPLLIDTDPGVDDALALLMAFNAPDHHVVGLTVTAGNVGLQHTTANALKLVEVCGLDVPVFAGADAPLLHPARDAGYVHGRDGFGDTAYAPATRQPEGEHAALAILRLSHAYAGRLLLVALGPLTNIALALKLDPTLPQRVGRFVVMGGAVSAHGNITPAAEFNIAFDPEAAHLVFAAFPRFELVDWEATVAHGFAHSEAEQWLACGSARATFYEGISRQTRLWSEDRRGDLWHAADALAMACALRPDHVLEWAERPVAVELAGRLTRGVTVVDWQRQESGVDNARIMLRYDPPAFQAMMRDALAVG